MHHNLIHDFISDETDLLTEYSKQLLNQYPCMRMIETENRHDGIIEDKEIHGIIYHTIKFCDYYGFDFSNIKKKDSPPLLKIETDALFSQKVS